MVLYDFGKHSLSAILPAGSSALVKADAVTADAPQTTCTGDVTIKGNLVVEGWRKVAEEDAPLVRQLQLQHRLRAELDIPTRFSPYWEPSVLRFQQLVIECLREP